MTFLDAWNLAFPPLMWVLALVCGVLSAIGFYKFVYFLSIGYGLAISGVGITLILMFSKSLSLGCLVQCLLLIVYGIRLSGFLLVREIKSITYRKTLEETTKTEKSMPIFVKFSIWICVIALYVAQTSPVYYRLANNLGQGIIPWVGALIMAVALIIETISDMQKSASKKQNPGRFCDTGLYKFIRCPNYFGEILFWTGVFISGFGALKGALQWIIAMMGYILIIYVMFSGAKRLEIRQNKNYGQRDEYQEYIKTTPILLPFTTLYSLTGWDFIKI